MRKLLITIGCIALAGCCGVVSALSEENATAAITMQEKAWSDAVIHHDTAKVAAILADDFVGIDGRGFVSDKAAELKEAAPPPANSTDPQLAKEELSDIKVRIYGDTAVLTAINTAHFSAAGKESVIKYRRTTVWERKSNAWRCVSFHGSRILEADQELIICDAQLLYIHSRWKDEAALDYHASLPHTVHFAERIEPLIGYGVTG